MRYFPMISQIFFKIVSLYPNSENYIDIHLYQNEIISFAFDRVFHGH